MLDEEKTRLKALLADTVERFKTRGDIILKDNIRLDEVDTQRHTTEAEILVFDLPRDDLAKLHVAKQTYEGFIDILGQDAFENGLFPLLVKARSLCPTAKFHSYQFAFRTGHDEVQFFQWYAKEFFDIPNRHSFAFWWKNYFNQHEVIAYPDDENK